MAIHEQAPASSKLQDKAKEIQKGLQNGGVGPTLAAVALCSVLDSWESYRAEAGGIDGDKWARDTFGNVNIVAIARRRATGVEELAAEGWREFALSRMHHEVLVLVTGDTVPPPKRKEVMWALQLETRRRANVLSPAQAMKVVDKALGRTRKPAVGQDREAVLLNCLREHRAVMTAAGLPLPALPEGVEVLADALERMTFSMSGPRMATE